MLDYCDYAAKFDEVVEQDGKEYFSHVVPPFFEVILTYSMVNYTAILTNT